MQIRLTSGERLRRRLRDRVPPRLLDVRSREEFEHAHIPGAVHVALDELAARAGELDPMVEWVVVSEHGIRSLRACEWLFGRGYLKVINLVGGMAELRSPVAGG